jgi:molybdopterin synthase catalytic subunit
MEKKVKNIFVEGAISPEFIAESISKHSTKKNIGAHSIFLGQVRKYKPLNIHPMQTWLMKICHRSEKIFLKNIT